MGRRGGKKVRLVVATALIAATGAACEKAAVDPADASPPTVEIKMKKGNEYVPVTAEDIATQPVDLIAVVDDPQGVRSLDVQFLGRTSDTCTIDSSVWQGSFPIELPDDVHQTTTADAEGKVTTKLPAFALIEPPECKKFGTDEKGVPFGHEITVRATGKSWGENAAANSASAELVLTVN